MKILITIALALALAYILIPRLAISEEAPPIATPVVVDVEMVIGLTFPDAPIMYHVAKAESWDYKSKQFNPKAKNPESTAKGVYQILDGTWKDWECVGDPLQALDNIMCARKGYDIHGTKPWNASKSVWGKYVVR